VRRVERHLDDSGSIAQVDEDEASEITCPMNPATEANGGTDMLGAQRAAEMRPMSCRQRRVGHHVGERGRSALAMSLVRSVTFEPLNV
jgi:hypothetical protein